jgi:hypothetical protein
MWFVVLTGAVILSGFAAFHAAKRMNQQRSKQ